MITSQVQECRIRDLLMADNLRNQLVERCGSYRRRQINELVVRVGRQAGKKRHGSWTI